MDWSTDDYTRTYADTIFVPEIDSDRGIYLLDEASRNTDPNTDAVSRAPIRPYNGDRQGRYGRARRAPSRGTPYNEYRTRPVKEGFEGGEGNVISDHTNIPAVYNNDWDERPMHYNPHAGTDWAELLPPPLMRPYSGGPTRAAMFPYITNSEAMNRPWTINWPSLASTYALPLTEGFAGGAGAPACACKSTLKILLFIIIIVILSMILVSVGKAAKSLENTMKSALEALKASKNVTG